MEVGDEVVVRWDRKGSESFHCPVCNQLISCPDYNAMDTICDACGSSFESVTAVRVTKKGSYEPPNPEKVIDGAVGK